MNSRRESVAFPPVLYQGPQNKQEWAVTFLFTGFLHTFSTYQLRPCLTLSKFSACRLWKKRMPVQERITMKLRRIVLFSLAVFSLCSAGGKSIFLFVTGRLNRMLREVGSRRFSAPPPCHVNQELLNCLLNCTLAVQGFRLCLSLAGKLLPEI